MSAFVSGGFVPAALRGTTLAGYIHICDWYGTLLPLAGADAEDDHPGLPGVDGVDQWPYITGKVATSPRTEMVIVAEYKPIGKPSKPQELVHGCLIKGDYKLLLGENLYGFWQGPVYPNATTDHKNEGAFNCTAGCLYNIQTDPSEYTDLAEAMPAELATMTARFEDLAQSRCGNFDIACDPISRIHRHVPPATSRAMCPVWCWVLIWACKNAAVPDLWGGGQVRGRALPARPGEVQDLLGQPPRVPRALLPIFPLCKFGIMLSAPAHSAEHAYT